MAAPASMEAVRAAFSEFAHDGVLPRADVGNALRRLGIAPTRSDLVVVLQELDPACAGRVGFDSFVKCYSHLAGGYKGSRFNRLLVKDVVGRARRSNYDLPPDTHVYGKVVTRDPESAGEVVLHWKAGTLSKPREQARNLVEMNKHAAAAGCIGAKAVRDFREGHDIRFKSKESFVKPQERPVSVPDIVFGQKNRPSTPIEQVMRGGFADMEEPDVEYPVVERRRPAAKKPTTVRPTKASQKLGTRAAGSAEAAAKEPFKLSKFKKVAPRVYASSPQRAEAGARRSTTLSAAGSAAAGHRRSPKSLSPRSVGSLDSPPHAGSEVY